MMAACLLAFSAGFLSLCVEILWVRLFGFANHSVPQGFAFVLVTFLLGIAFGAYIGKWFCKREKNLWLVCGVALLISSVFDVAGPWWYAEVAHSQKQIWCGGLMIILTALLKSIVFPIAHHLGAPLNDAHTGRSVSRVYASNILGATLGPIFTGMLLLSYFTTQQGFLLCSAMTFLVALLCLAKLVNPASLLAATATGLVLFNVGFTYDKHGLIKKVANNGDIVQVVENQHGIITVYHKAQGGDLIAGGNVYDGRANVDPIVNSNGIDRVIMLSALHDQPKRILMIGLSVGSWLKIVTSFPGVKAIDVVEINPGYLDVIEHYPAQSNALRDPRVHLYIDDARRWLKAHLNERYDMVIMNTTYHWRAYSGNLLSIEFIELLKRHMNNHAVLAYNSTDSPDVLKTANAVFAYAYLYKNFVIAADFDWRDKFYSPLTPKRLAVLKLDGQLIFPPGSDKVIDHYLKQPLIPIAQIEAFYHSAGRQVEIVTDRNLITEYKYGKSLS